MVSCTLSPISFFLPVIFLDFFKIKEDNMYIIIMQKKNIGHHARLKENEHLFRYRA